MIIYTHEIGNGHIDTKLNTALKNCMISAKVKINFEIKCVPRMLRLVLEKWTLDQDIDNLVLQLEPFANIISENRVLIATDNNSSFAKWCKSQNPKAFWGCNLEFISIDYAPRENRLFSQLHESLHLFGVDDCYEATTECRPKKNCDNSDCVMRYGATSEKICKRVGSELKKYSENNG